MFVGKIKSDNIRPISKLWCILKNNRTMRISILIFLLCFSKLIFGQVSFSYSTKQPYYSYNNNLDTIYFSVPTLFQESKPYGIEFRRVECEIELIESIVLSDNITKRFLFQKTCTGVGYAYPMGCSQGEENFQSKTYEIWDIENKEQLFSATYFLDYDYNFGQCGGPNYSVKNQYNYNFSIDSGRITISNLKMEPSKIEYDSISKYNRTINSLQVDNKVGVYQFDGKRFIKQPDIETIRIIFNEFISNQESTDTDFNKELMTNSLKSITVVKDKNDLDLLINVWMYYDPTDYPDIPEIYRILKDSRPHSIEAVKNRIDNKKEWETDNTAPYSELQYLLKRLENE
jgi:hypothetical protein